MNLIWLSAIVAGAAFTATESKITKPMRDLIFGYSEFLGELFSCGYCMAHWFALVVVAIARPELPWNPWVDYLVGVLTVTWLASLQWAVMCALLKLAEK